MPELELVSAIASNVPSACADSSTGSSVFSTTAPSVFAFDPRFEQPRSLRTAGDWSSPILDNRFVLGLQGVYSWNMNQPGIVDINLESGARLHASRPRRAARSSSIRRRSCRRPARSRSRTRAGRAAFQNVVDEPIRPALGVDAVRREARAGHGEQVSALGLQLLAARRARSVLWIQRSGEHRGQSVRPRNGARTRRRASTSSPSNWNSLPDRGPVLRHGRHDGASRARSSRR